jgi:hypothetical protein
MMPIAWSLTLPPGKRVAELAGQLGLAGLPGHPQSALTRATVSRMEFTLVFMGRTQHFTGAASYRFDKHGLLVIADGKGKQLTYAPSAWHYIEEDERPSGAFVGS